MHVKLLIVVVNFRVPELTIECLRSLEGEIGAIPGTLVVVVENGSGDDSATLLRAAINGAVWRSWARLRVSAENLGFTGGNNIAIRDALRSLMPEYVLLLNPDTVVTKGSLAALVSFMDTNPSVGIGGSRLIFPDGSLQGSPFRFHGIASQFEAVAALRPVTKLLRRWRVVVDPKPERACRVDWVSGASMMVRREVFDAIGLLDEGLFTYFDDVDFCLRASRAGWSTAYVPESCVVHLEGASSGMGAQKARRLPSYWFEARRRFFLKNHGPCYAAAVDAATIGGLCIRRMKQWLRSPQAQDAPCLLIDTIRHSVFLAGFGVPTVAAPVKTSGPDSCQPPARSM